MALSSLLIFALVLAGCGASKRKIPNPYHVTTTASIAQGPIVVRHITYTAFDGERVPALFSIPRATSPRGCLIWQHGFGVGASTEQAQRFWYPAARLGLGVFAIDLRDTGQRATSPRERARVLNSPALLKALVVGTVKDLKRATDYLYSQPACHHNIGFAGLSLGGAVGSVFTAQDPRIRVVVLMSVPPSWQAGVQDVPYALPGFRHQPARLRAALRTLSPLDPARWIGQISPRPLLLLFGRFDPIVPASSRRVDIAVARQPKAVVVYNGGHVPFLGPAAAESAYKVGLFLLKYLVEPTYGALGQVVTPAGAP